MDGRAFADRGEELSAQLAARGVDLVSGLTEVASALGAAVLSAQLFETVVRLCSVAPNRPMDAEPDDAVEQAMDRRLEDAIRHLEAARADGRPEAIPVVLHDARFVRNWLVHDFVMVSFGRLLAGDQAAVVTELRRMSATFDALARQLLGGSVLDEAIASRGVDPGAFGDLIAVLTQIAGMRPDVFDGDVRDGTRLADALERLADELGIDLEDGD